MSRIYVYMSSRSFLYLPNSAFLMSIDNDGPLYHIGKSEDVELGGPSQVCLGLLPLWKCL